MVPQKGNVVLKGHLDVPAEKLEAVRAALPEHIALTRAEAGCIRFEVRFSETQPDRLLVSEIFENQTAFDAHQQRAGHSSWASVSQGIERHYTTELID